MIYAALVTCKCSSPILIDLFSLWKSQHCRGKPKNWLGQKCSRSRSFKFKLYLLVTSCHICHPPSSPPLTGVTLKASDKCQNQMHHYLEQIHSLNIVRNIWDNVSTHFNQSYNKDIVVFWQFNGKVLHLNVTAVAKPDFECVTICNYGVQLAGN